MSKRLTAIIQAEPPGFVALCPELDVASQGGSIEESLANLREAVELFYECASEAEISAREGGEIYITQLEVSVGYASSTVRQGSLRNTRAPRIC
jgi:predicted RNase H-like HicB family nuclease